MITDTPTSTHSNSFLRRLLRYRLILAVLAPVLGLVAFSAYVVQEKLASYQESADLLLAAQVARTAHGLARELENERGASAMYIGTDRRLGRQDVDEQRLLTDERLNDFRTLAAQPKIQMLLGRQRADLGLGDIAALRDGIDADNDLMVMLEGYGTIIARLIGASSKLGSADLSNVIAAYMDLGNIKDRLARERSIGASWLLRGRSDRGLLILFTEAHAERKAFLESFRGHASPEQLRLYDEVVRGPILDEIARLQNLAVTGRLTMAEANAWHRTHLAMGERITHAEEKLAGEMESRIHAKLRSAQLAFYLVVLVVVALIAFSLETLRRSERRAVIWEEEARKLFRAVEQSPVSVVITDTGGTIEYVNPAFTRMTGFVRDEVLGRNPRILRSTETPRRVYTDLWHTIRSGNEWRGELVNRRKDGTLYWEQMTIAPVKAGDGRVDNYIALKEDITEVRNLRLALEREHANIRRVLEATRDGIALISADGRFEYVNPALEAEFGAVDGRHSEAYFDAPTPQPDERPTWQEWQGNGKTYEVTASPVHSTDGKLSVLLAFHDITVRKQAEQALNDARLAAELANRSKSEFLSTMSHELRTPLNAIIGFSEIIEHQLLGNVGQPQYVEYAHDINESGRHLLQLINDILDVARLEVGRIALHEDRVDLNEVLSGCVTMLRERAEAAQVLLVDQVPADLPGLWADEHRIKQVIVNVLGNAIKFTPPGGEVLVSTMADADGLVIRIADSGIGIAPSDIAKVMAPFGQADSSMARRYEGSGLGLPLSRQLMELHNGGLRLDSRLGAGTVVTLHFPLERLRQG